LETCTPKPISFFILNKSVAKALAIFWIEEGWIAIFWICQSFAFWTIQKLATTHTVFGSYAKLVKSARARVARPWWVALRSTPGCAGCAKYSDIGCVRRKRNLPLNLPHEPAPWAGVAALLIEEGQHGIEAVMRLRDSIRFSHRSLNLPDPTSDHVINAILRSIANGQDPAPAEAAVAD